MNGCFTCFKKNFNLTNYLCNGKKAVNQLVEINEDFTICYHNKFVYK